MTEQREKEPETPRTTSVLDGKAPAVSGPEAGAAATGSSAKRARTGPAKPGDAARPVRRAPRPAGRRAPPQPRAKRPRGARPGSGLGAEGRPARHVLMVASEALPFSKTGGLADVTQALPLALGRAGQQITLVVPRYRGSEASGPLLTRLRVELPAASFEVDCHEQTLAPGVRALLLDCPPLFDRGAPYGEAGRDYPDNPLRFAVLARAALELGATLDPPVDLVHAHDWQAGLVPVLLATRYRSDRYWGSVPSVFTIHNLAYQGAFDAQWVPRVGLGWELFTAEQLEFWGRISYLKGGVNFATLVTTVSPRYAQEILTPEFGFGFEGILTQRRTSLVGILNGIDYATWDPGADPFLPAPFDATDLEGKVAAKKAVLERFGLPVSPASLERPVIGMISRMVDQKGLDIIVPLADELLQLDATFIVLGTGEERYQHFWWDMASRDPRRFAVWVGFDESRAHLIEGGADLFLMPSRFEPCGLNQMYSLRYGTLPVVRATGGLDDTVENYDERTGEGTGFKFRDYSPAALLGTLRWALAVFGQKPAWRRMQQAGMARDFSWDRSARDYLAVYERARQVVLPAARA